MYINKNVFRAFIASVALAACAPLLNAQNMKYVTYFPTPHAYYSQLNVIGPFGQNSVALLATLGHNYNLESAGVASGEVIVGSPARFANGNLAVFRAQASFAAKNMLVRANNAGSEFSLINMGVQSALNPAKNSDGLFGTYGSVNITTAAPAPWAIVANEKLIVGGLNWFNNNSTQSGIGTGGAAFPVLACGAGHPAKLMWKQLRLKDTAASKTTDSFRFYLVYNCS